jgi:polyhydroxybutyrate depolymerase
MKILRLVFIYASFIILSSFSSETFKDKEYTLTHDGLVRSYLVHPPQNYDPQKTYPLVIALHGGGGNAKSFNRSTRGRFNDLADEENFILVYPQGFKKSWNDNNIRDTIGKARKLNIDDVGFIKKMIEKLETDFSVDSENIFACGISNGGLMSLTLAAELPEKIKTIGMVASNFSRAQVDEMQSVQPFSMIMIHGTDDPIFPYEEGVIKVFKQRRGEVIGVVKSVDFMLDLNGNFTPGIIRPLPNVSQRDGCTATHIVYPNPTNPNLKVEVISVIGGGHTWPGGTQYLSKRLIGRTSRDFNACDTLWDFFESTMN